MMAEIEAVSGKFESPFIKLRGSVLILNINRETT